MCIPINVNNIVYPNNKDSAVQCDLSALGSNEM